MRIPRLFVDLELAVGETRDLDARARRYLLDVLRLRSGRTLRLFNGRGGEYSATLVDCGKRRASVLVDDWQPLECESPLAVTLVQGISRGERMDYTVQKAVELGATHIQPVWAERSEVRLAGPRLAKKLDHWRGIVVSACEQSGRNRLAELTDPMPLADWLTAHGGSGLRLVLEPGSPTALRQLSAQSAVSLLVGPEGGWSEAELAACADAGCTPVHLGPRVLRTETAGLAALTIVQSLWGDLA